MNNRTRDVVCTLSYLLWWKSLHGFSRVTTRVLFHTAGECCHLMAALKTFVRKVLSFPGRFLKTLFKTLLGPGALSSLQTVGVVRRG